MQGTMRARGCSAAAAASADDLEPDQDMQPSAPSFHCYGFKLFLPRGNSAYELHVEAAENLPPDGLARPWQCPINRGHGFQHWPISFALMLKACTGVRSLLTYQHDAP